MKCEYNEEKFDAELERLQNIENTYKEKKQTIVIDSENFNYPAYVSVFNFDSAYGYALTDEENNTIYYIYLRFINKEDVVFEEKLLLRNYLEDKNKYNIYMYELESMDGWYYNKE